LSSAKSQVHRILELLFAEDSGELELALEVEEGEEVVVLHQEVE
jgi:hypothetical protein